MSGQNSLIIASDYNAIQSKIATVMGSGSTDYGYGQTIASAQVSQNAVISAIQWGNLRNDILRARQHQVGTDQSGLLTNPQVGVTITATNVTNNRLTTPTTDSLSIDLPVTFSGTLIGGVASGTTYYISQVVSSTEFTISATLGGSVFAVTTGTGSMTMSFGGIKITEADRAAYLALATTCETDRLTTPIPSTQATRSVGFATGQRTTAWNAQIYHTVTVTFNDVNGTASADAARYFFNSGSQIEISADRQGGSGGLKNSTWTTLLQGLGTIVFNYNSTTATNGTTGNSAYGWSTLTTTEVIIFERFITGSYSPNRYYIKASKNVAGNAIVFKIYFDDANQSSGSYGSSYTDENVDGTLTSKVEVYRATGTNVAVLLPAATNNGNIV